MLLWLLLLLPTVPVTAGPASDPPGLQVPLSDLDRLMARALAHRADAWRTLGQYILDERELLEVRGPLGVPLFGERREFTWFEREGYFVRSPLTVNGVDIGLDERRAYEARWLKREKARAERRAARAQRQSDSAPADALAGQAEPRFISAAYFLDFKFEPGNYYLAGREMFNGHPVLKIDYFPRRLFSDDEPDAHGARKERRDTSDTTIEAQINKVARITLWVDETQALILRYVFENVDFDFLPAQWLVRVDDVRAEMTMHQPFPGVWLPHQMTMDAAASLANGEYSVRYGLTFHDYRLGDVTSRIRFDGRRP